MRERTVYFSPQRLRREARTRELRMKPQAQRVQSSTVDQHAEHLRRAWLTERDGAQSCQPPNASPEHP